MKRKAWVVTVDMGYGHQRAAYPLKDIAFERVITANSDKLISERERKAWSLMKSFYDLISRINSIPFIGKFIFGLYDKLQGIAAMYPFRDLSAVSFPVLYCRYLASGRKLNLDMVRYMERSRIPLVTTFYYIALVADYNSFKGRVYCIITDTDINRIWVSSTPDKSRITYLSPCGEASKRLLQYGVPRERIILTGFPLPKENIGGPSMKVLKHDLGARIANLDPKKKYLRLYRWHVKNALGRYFRPRSGRPLTLTFAVGGAGAQTELGYTILKSLKRRILAGDIRMNIVVGTRIEANEYFRAKISELGLEQQLGKGVSILFTWDKLEYFRAFNQLLRNTDILWTKPSELSFYAGLGLPIIIAPPIGSHEFMNRNWLLGIGAGIAQDNPKYTDEWLFDLVESGRLADAAMQGFVEAPKMGAYNVEQVLFSKKPRIRL